MDESKNSKLKTNIIKELDQIKFKETYFKYLSPYFINLFSDYFRKIEEQRIDKNTGKIIFYLELDQKCANLFNIAHGGALVSIIENLSTASLIYFDNTHYKTLDFNINFKNQVELNQIIKIEFNCEKIGYNTCFVEAEVKRENTVCTKASIIKSKMKYKF